MIPPDTLEEREAAFHSDFVANWRRPIEAEIEVGDVEALAVLFVDLFHALRELRALVSDVEERLFEVMPDKRLELPGLPVMEKRSGQKRTKWRIDELVQEVTTLALVDRETGALPDDPKIAVELVVALMKDVFPFTPSMGVRVTPLKALGFQIDEWCETAPGKQSIQVHE